MDFLAQMFDYFRHLDVHLAELLRQYGAWTYVILFAIIFAETGLVVTPFLPGDSLLFAAGAITAAANNMPGEPALNILLLWLVLVIAAVVGDSVNYQIGRAVGTKVFKEEARVMKLEYLRKTEGFYARYGGKTIILARFIPIVRTYAPFVAGASKMDYAKFLTFNVIGGVIWITLFLFAGYFFGNIPVIQHNFEYVVIGIILVSLLPPFLEWLKHRRSRTVGDVADATGTEPRI
ncbi:DedA family protein [Longimicrobium terrae]|uniref:Membrane-associated protein n=1 Tax=Longimicrobium terrae TaxID=1639882 RepID=A0A841H0J0_9BACT|nr:DedA family protein [Longimicrobium terrae]MBB4637199.1 membrane-associated protein [Longimicrobium terrae]MBB6071540.1 membrane-associated protein [Longimicrobium terrae]NNC30041.1 DedA family protein [Longimicrobium terrae]